MSDVGGAVVFYMGEGFVEKMISVVTSHKWRSDILACMGYTASLLPNWGFSKYLKSPRHTRIICKT